MALVLVTVLRRVAVRATLAASVRNSQPWHLTLHPDRLVVRADRTRRLPVFDPTERQLVMSYGAAVLSARAAFVAAGLAADIRRGSVAACAGDTDDLTVLRTTENPASLEDALAALGCAARRRRSSWGPVHRTGDPGRDCPTSRRSPREPLPALRVWPRECSTRTPLTWPSCPCGARLIRVVVAVCLRGAPRRT